MSIFDRLKAEIEKAVGKDKGLPGYPFFKALEEDTRYSPDKWKLQQREKVWLFVHGEEMMRHDKNVPLMGLFEPQYSGMTFEDYKMWKAALGKDTHPIPLDAQLEVEDRNWFQQKYKLPWAKVKGELYLVPPEVIFHLDKYRENGVVYSRKRTEIIVSYRNSTFSNKTRSFLDFKYEHQNIRAWMYVGKIDYWAELINDGVTHGRFKPVRAFTNDNLNKTYYYFTQAEYQPLK